jgi:hypothetical protein
MDHRQVEMPNAASGISGFLVVFAPYGVSFVALAGAIVSNYMTGKNMLAAERKRALDAISAENIRHENEMRRATRSNLLDRIRDLYVDLERARRELVHATWPLSETYGGVPDWLRKTEEDRVRFRESVANYRHVHDTVTLLGSREVSAMSGEVLSTAMSVTFAARVLAGDDLTKPNTELRALFSGSGVLMSV